MALEVKTVFFLVVMNEKAQGAGMLGGWQCGFFIWMCFVFGNSLSYILIMCAFFSVCMSYFRGKVQNSNKQ